MLVPTIPHLPTGWTPAGPISAASRALRALMDQDHVYGLGETTPITPDPSKVDAGPDSRGWGRRYSDGSALLNATHNGADFILPWPVKGQGDVCGPTHAQAGWTALTECLSTFVWRAFRHTPPPEVLEPYGHSLMAIARASAALLRPHGVVVDTVEWSLSPAQATEDGDILHPSADVSTICWQDLTPHQNTLLTAAFQIGQDAAAALTAQTFSTPDQCLQTLSQGIVVENKTHNGITVRRYADLALQPLLSGQSTVGPMGLHDTLAAWRLLRAHIPADTPLAA